MPDIRPFRGVRYDMARVGTLSDVVAPPYDVIDPALAGPALRGQPVQHHPAGAEPRGAGGHRGAGERYARAARFLKRLAAPGRSSARTTTPALYVYEQTFDVEGTTHTRKGFLARVRLEPFGQGKIYPHEQTLSGPKADRLALYHATGFNLSPIFGLYPDPEGEVLRAVEAGLRDRTPLVATDHLGVENRLWVVDDQRDAHGRPGPDGLEAGLHRRRPPPLRDRPEVPRRAGRRPASWPATTTRPTSA